MTKAKPELVEAEREKVERFGREVADYERRIADPGRLAHLDAEAYLDALGPAGIRLGLERVHTLLAALGRPERGLRAIHVVGTNGKSSTVAMAAAALLTTGRRVGAYLSPAVGGSAQTIRLDGRPMSAPTGRPAGAGAGGRRGRRGDRGAADTLEALAAAALLAFAAAGVDVAVVEAGLGGRLDATNVLGGPVVGLTNVSLDHTDLLGDTPRADRRREARRADGGRAAGRR